MYRDFLRRFNSVIFILIVLAAILVQSTIFTYFPLSYIQPDFILLLAVYFGMRRGFIEGGILIMIASMIAEDHSSTGKFFFLTTNLYAFVIAKIFSKTVILGDFLSNIRLVSLLLFLKRLGILILLGFAGKAGNGLRHFLIFLIPGLVTHALITPLCFSWFQTIDMKTYKDDRAEDELFLKDM